MYDNIDNHRTLILCESQPSITYLTGNRMLELIDHLVGGPNLVKSHMRLSIKSLSISNALRDKYVGTCVTIILHVKKVTCKISNPDFFFRKYALLAI